mmetsp:Transcript_34871/g.66583  ORF Transcript_34871/g.66583 Transcript_34871/m.66583 type:complete len:222 (-) Transcript_34871:938-1603(-)
MCGADRCADFPLSCILTLHPTCGIWLIYSCMITPGSVLAGFACLGGSAACIRAAHLHLHAPLVLAAVLGAVVDANLAGGSLCRSHASRRGRGAGPCARRLHAVRGALRLTLAPVARRIPRGGAILEHGRRRRSRRLLAHVLGMVPEAVTFTPWPRSALPVDRLSCLLRTLSGGEPGQVRRSLAGVVHGSRRGLDAVHPHFRSERVLWVQPGGLEEPAARVG